MIDIDQKFLTAPSAFMILTLRLRSHLEFKCLSFPKSFEDLIIS